MSKTEMLTVEVPEELAAVVHNAVQEGEYCSDDEAVSDALLTWTAQRRDEDTARIRAAVQEAIDHGVYVTMDEIFEPLKARYQAMIDAERKG